MGRSKLFVGEQTPTEVAWNTIGYIALFSLCLAAESFFEAGVNIQAQAKSCAGVIIGVMAIVHTRFWKPIIAISFVLRFGFDLVVFEGQVAVSFLHSVSLVGASVLAGIVTLRMLRRPRRDLLTSELFAPSALGIVLATLVYGVLSAAVVPRIAFSALSIITSGLSLTVGIAIVSLGIICIGLPFGHPRATGPGRVLWIIIFSALFQLGICIGFNHYPVISFINVGQLEYALIWIAVPLLIMITIKARGLAVAWNLLIMLIVASVGWTMELGHFTDVNSKILLLEWQASIIAFTFIGVTCLTLVSNLRYVRQKQRLQYDIATRLLSVNPYNDGGENASDTQKALNEVLADVGDFCGADECRLYRIDIDHGSMQPSSRWRRSDKTPALPIDEIGFKSVRWFFNDVIDGKPIYYRYDERIHGSNPKILNVLSLPKYAEIFCEPVGVDRTVTGLIMLISYNNKRLVLRDAPPLLAAIGSFFANEQIRLRAKTRLTSMEQRLRELAANLTMSDERVRRHTSVDLHDGLIQQLAVARMKLGELRYRRVSAPDTVDKITGIIDETLATTRRIVQELSPSVLYELGLAPGIQSLCEQTTDNGTIPVELIEEGDRQHLAEPMMVSLYEVVRELINNSERHSGGSRIWVHIVWGEQSLKYISVSDDGVHQKWWELVDSSPSVAGLGLLSNSERLRAFGYGTVFEARPGGGTRATVVPASATSQQGIFSS